MFIFRFLSTIILIPAFLFAIMDKSGYGYVLFVGIAVFLSFFSSWEYLKMLKNLDKPSYPVITSITSALIIFSLIQQTQVAIYLTLTAIIAFIVFCWTRLLVSKNKLDVFESIVNSVSAIFLIIIPLSFIGLLYVSPNKGQDLLLYLVLVTKAGDMGAYCVGVSTNKIFKNNHKIVPSISPKKSWEGTIGGMVVSVGISLLLWNKLNLGTEVMYLIPVISGIVLFIGGFTGDLVESALKRLCGVKDSGRTIPGIGGVLDLVDSLLINAPIFTLFCFYFIF